MIKVLVILPERIINCSASIGVETHPAYKVLSMKNKNIIEDIIGIAIKNPVIGFVLSIVFAGLGFYLTSKQTPISAKPTGLAFLPLLQFVGMFCYIFSVVVLIFALIGFIRRKGQMRL